MKLFPPMSAAVDVESETLHIIGVDENGQEADVEIAYGDGHEFIGWLMSVFQGAAQPEDGERAILADSVFAGLHKIGDRDALSFTFVSDQLKLTFATPLRAKSPERIAAIQGHLEQLFAEMAASDDVLKQ
jgi:hypothetical protein